MGQNSRQGWQQLRMGSLCGSGAKLAAAHRPAAQSGQRRCPHPAAPESAPAECQDAINLKPVINETVITVLLCTTCLSRCLAQSFTRSLFSGSYPGHPCSMPSRGSKRTSHRSLSRRLKT